MKRYTSLDLEEFFRNLLILIYRFNNLFDLTHT
jgi:hypothetical protein